MVGDRLDQEIVEAAAVLAITRGCVNLDQNLDLLATDGAAGGFAGSDQNAGTQPRVLAIDRARKVYASARGRSFAGHHAAANFGERERGKRRGQFGDLS